ncbi:capsular polysaccharide synthesis protein [Vibrio plantisponsor]|uniref:capsular polysaccharide synthesis protein n=1 Tax=Vibrio plantisponsor TaxID=664643 RepID=UPI00370C6B8A
MAVSLSRDILQNILNLSICRSERRDKTIWLYWDKGIENAPELIKNSYSTWKRHNNDYDVIFLDDSNLSKILGFDFNIIFEEFINIELTSAGKSDLLRLYILYRFGGVWADSTTFCLRPISDWLDIKETGFFIFRQPDSCLDRQMVSWFMASNQGNKIVKDLLYTSITFLSKKRNKFCKITDIIINDDTKEYISRTRTGYKYLDYAESQGSIPYFWMFYLWNEISPKYKDEIEKMNRMPNNYIQPKGFYSKFTKAFVSKQTYRSMGPVIDSYKKQRVHYINTGIMPNRVVSIHLPKTAGTYFRKVLFNSLGERVHFDYGDRILDYSVDALKIRNKSHVNVNYNYDFIHGHFYLKKYFDSKTSHDFVTILREPLELMISMYNYLNNREDNNILINMAKTLSFEEFALHRWFNNHITRQLSDCPLKEFKLIGFQDNLETFLKKFELTYGVELNRNVLDTERNITLSSKVNIDTISHRFKNIFYEKNKNDYNFYHLARKSNV